MVRRRLTAQFAAQAMGLALFCGAISGGTAVAGQKLAVFPVDMSFPKSEEDYFFGPRGPSPEEQKRLDLVREDLVRRLAEDGRYEVLDISPIATEIKAAQPIGDCNGCEIDLAKKVSADFVMTSAVDKISETHLSLNVAIIDVAKSVLVSNASVLIQGNTDEAWLHGVKWLAKNRLFAEGKKQ